MSSDRVSFALDVDEDSVDGEDGEAEGHVRRGTAGRVQTGGSVIRCPRRAGSLRKAEPSLRQAA